MNGLQQILNTGTNVVFVNAEEVLSGVRSLLEEYGLKPLGVQERAGKEQLPAELPTRQVKKILKEKGYRADSHYAFKALLKNYGVAEKKRGREYWYPTEQINAIPDNF